MHLKKEGIQRKKDRKEKKEEKNEIKERKNIEFCFSLAYKVIFLYLLKTNMSFYILVYCKSKSSTMTYVHCLQ